MTNTLLCLLQLTKLGIANDKALFLHFLVRDLSLQKLLQVLGKLALNNTSDSGQGVGGILEFLESLQFNTIWVVKSVNCNVSM
jgi:hypothetical protein